MQVLASHQNTCFDDTKINQGLTKPQMATNYATKNPQVTSYSSCFSTFFLLSFLFFFPVCMLCMLRAASSLRKNGARRGRVKAKD